MSRHIWKIAPAWLVCLTCLGCFCVEPDILPPDKAERLKAVPEGTWATYSEKYERQDDLVMDWSDEHGCYTGLGEGQPESETVLLRLYRLATPPFYAMLMIPTTPSRDDADLDCPAALFLVRVQEGKIEFVLPLDMPEAEIDALAQANGVDMVNEKLVGPPDGVLGFLDGLAQREDLDVLQTYVHPAPPKEAEPQATPEAGEEVAPDGRDGDKPRTKR